MQDLVVLVFSCALREGGPPLLHSLGGCSVSHWQKTGFPLLQSVRGSSLVHAHLPKSGLPLLGSLCGQCLLLRDAHLRMSSSIVALCLANRLSVSSALSEARHSRSRCLLRLSLASNAKRVVPVSNATSKQASKNPVSSLVW